MKERGLQQVEVFTLWELVDRLLTLQGGSLDDVWAVSRNALYQQLERAAHSGKLRVRHPDTMLPEVFSEWAQPSSGCLVCTIDDVNAWLASEGAPYSMTPVPDSNVAQLQAVPAVAPPVDAESAIYATVKNSPPVATGDVAFAFDGLRGWDEKAWKDTLGTPPKWLRACMALPGQQGVRANLWNPVLIGAALVSKHRVKQNSVRARFQTKPQISGWLEAWKTYEAENFDTQ